MATERFAGFYVPGLVLITVAAPVGPAGAAVVIPGLPAEAAFPLTVTGRAADTFAAGDQTTDTFTLQAGADGEVVAVRSLDPTGSITITCMRSSIANLAFSAAHNASRNNLVPLFFTFPVTVKDPLSPGSIFSGLNCVIQRAAPVEYGASEGENTWTFLAAQYAASHGARVF